MQVVVLATDAGSSNALELVAGEIAKKRCVPTTCFGRGQPLSPELNTYIGAAVAKADRVLIGLSSSPERAEAEIAAAAMAKKHGVPFGFFCFAYGEYRLPWFTESLRDANFLFVLNEQEVEEARQFAPKATIVASGNPVWSTYFDTALRRDEVCSILEVNPKSKVAVVVGANNSKRNTPLLDALDHALKPFPQLRVFFAVHPGEPEGRDKFEAWAQKSRQQISMLKDIDPLNALAACDLVISSLSSLGIAAACRRIPVIDWIGIEDEAAWSPQGGIGIWKPLTAGASVRASTVEELQKHISELLDCRTRAFKHVRDAQQTAFAQSDIQGSLRQITKTLLF